MSTPSLSQPTAPCRLCVTTPGTRVRRAWLLALLASAAAVVHADDETERELLARIAAELQQVQAMVTEAARSAPPAARVKFRYDWLERDLQMLRDGVQQHVDAPRQPRPVPPLRGDYRN